MFHTGLGSRGNRSGGPLVRAGAGQRPGPGGKGGPRKQLQGPSRRRRQGRSPGDLAGLEHGRVWPGGAQRRHRHPRRQELRGRSGRRNDPVSPRGPQEAAGELREARAAGYDESLLHDRYSALYLYPLPLPDLPDPQVHRVHFRVRPHGPQHLHGKADPLSAISSSGTATRAATGKATLW